MKARNLGRGGPAVGALGLGCMGMSGGYGAADEAESIATIHAALDADVTMLDTGDFYGRGHNEMVVGRALKGGWRDRAFVAVKFGALRGPDNVSVGYDLRPMAVRNFCAYSLTRLGVDHIDLYMPARVDPDVPVEETIGAIADLVKEGYVRHIGMSEVSSATLRRAHAVHPIRALQIEYGLMTRGIERDILPAARELGISITAYGVLSRGLISNRLLAGGDVPGETRKRMPRFAPDNLPRNLALVAELDKIAREKGTTVSQLAIAWVLARGDDIVPLVGARKPAQLADAVGALAISLSPADMAAIERALPAEAVRGERSGPRQMAHMDSERAP